MKRFILFILFILINWSFAYAPQEKQTTIKFGDNIMIKRIGEVFDVKVSIENAVQVIGLNAWITYDPTIVKVVDSDPSTDGVQPNIQDLGFFGSNAVLLVGLQKDSNDDEIPGTLVCGYSTMPASPTDGSGDAFQVQFEAIAQGETDIDFAIGHINLQDMDGDIPTDSAPDSVSVPQNATVRIEVL